MCSLKRRAAYLFSTLSTAKSTQPSTLQDTKSVMPLAATVLGVDIVLKKSTSRKPVVFGAAGKESVLSRSKFTCVSVDFEFTHIYAMLPKTLSAQF